MIIPPGIILRRWESSPGGVRVIVGGVTSHALFEAAVLPGMGAVYSLAWCFSPRTRATVRGDVDVTLRWRERSESSGRSQPEGRLIPRFERKAAREDGTSAPGARRR